MIAALTIGALIAGMILADVLQSMAWRRFVAEQRKKTEAIDGR
jgi:hypothetical protein